MRLDNKEWVEGYLYEFPLSGEVFIKSIDLYNHKVIKDTIHRCIKLSQGITGRLWSDCDIVQFKYIIPYSYNTMEEKSIVLNGVFTFNTNELRYEINVYSKEYPEYTCLYYDSCLMSDFNIIGNVYDTPELLFN